MQLAQNRGELPELPGPPEELLQQLRRAGQGTSRGWSAFGASRAKVVMMLITVCRGGDVSRCRAAVLSTVEELIELGGEAPQGLLRFFLAEILASAMVLWHLMAQEDGAQRACRACGKALKLAGDLIPLQATPPRLLELLLLLAEVYLKRAVHRS